MATQLSVDIKFNLNGAQQTITTLEEAQKMLVSLVEKSNSLNQALLETKLGSDAFNKLAAEIEQTDNAITAIRSNVDVFKSGFVQAMDKSIQNVEKLKAEINAGLTIDNFLAATGQIAESLINTNQLIQLSNEGAADSIAVLERAARSYLAIQSIRNTAESIYNSSLVAQKLYLTAVTLATNKQTEAQIALNIAKVKGAALTIALGGALTAAALIFIKFSGGLTSFLEKVTAGFDAIVAFTQSLGSLTKAQEAYNRSLANAQLEKELKLVEQLNKSLSALANTYNTLANNAFLDINKKQELTIEAAKLDILQIEKELDAIVKNRKQVNEVVADGLKIWVDELKNFNYELDYGGELIKFFQLKVDDVVSSSKQLGLNQEQINKLLELANNYRNKNITLNQLIAQQEAENIKRLGAQEEARLTRKKALLEELLNSEIIGAKQRSFLENQIGSLELEILNKRIETLNKLKKANKLTAEDEIELANKLAEKETLLISLQNKRISNNRAILEETFRKEISQLNIIKAELQTRLSLETNLYSEKIALQEQLNKTTLNGLLLELKVLEEKQKLNIINVDELNKINELKQEINSTEIANQIAINKLKKEQFDREIEQQISIKETNNELSKKLALENELAKNVLKEEVFLYETIGKNLNSTEGVFADKTERQKQLNKELELENELLIKNLEESLNDLDVKGEILTLKRLELENAKALSLISDEEYQKQVELLDLQDKIIQKEIEATKLRFNIDIKILKQKGKEGAETLTKSFLDNLRNLLDPNNAFSNIIGDAAESLFKNITESQKEFLTKSIEDLGKSIKDAINLIITLNGQAIENELVRIREKLKTFDKEKERLEESLRSVEDRIKTLQSLLVSAEGSRREEIISQLERENALRDKNREAIENQIESINKLKEEEQKLEKEREANAKKQERISKIIVAAQSAIALAYALAAVSKAAAEGGVAAPVTVALTTAAVAAGVGLVVSIIDAVRPLEEGGILEGPSHAEGGIRGTGRFNNIEVEGGEYVINKRSTAKYKPILDFINADKSYETGGVLTPNFEGLKTIDANQIIQPKVFLSVVDVAEGLNRVQVIDSNALI
jgi:hypothetical protein